MSGSGLLENFPSSGPDPTLSEVELDNLLALHRWDEVDIEWRAREILDEVETWADRFLASLLQVLFADGWAYVGSPLIVVPVWAEPAFLVWEPR